jgi:hypothetical protein
LWYFLHYDKDIHGTPSKKSEQKNMDVSIIKLIWLVKELPYILKSNKAKIQSGLADYLDNRIFPVLMNGLTNACQSNDPKSLLIENIIDVINNTDWKGDLANSQVFNNLTFTWLRYQNLMVLTNTSFEHSLLMSEFLQILGFIADFESRVTEVCCLKDLLYSQNSMLEHVRDVLASESQLLKYIEVLGYVGVDFLSNYNPAWPLTAAWINSHSMCYTTEVYAVIGHYCASLLHEVALNTIGQYMQNLSNEAVKSFPRSEKLSKLKSKQKTEVTNRPGFESQFNGGDKELMTAKVQLRWLAFTLSHRQKIPLDLVDLHPFNFFVDSLCLKFKAFLNQDLHTTVPQTAKTHQDSQSINADVYMTFEVKRPSVFCRQVKAYIAAVAQIDRIHHMNCARHLQEVWADATNYEQGQRIADSLPDGLIFSMKNKIKGLYKAPTLYPFLIVYIRWYFEFLVSKAYTGTTVFSPSYMAFCNIAPSTIEAEQFTDRTELEALCQLIGLSGYQLLDEKLSRLITVQGAGIDDSLLAHKDLLLIVRNGRVELDSLAKMSCMFSLT